MSNRKHSKIDALQPEIKDIVEQMLLAGSTYSEVVDYLAQNEVQLSISAVHRYATNMRADIERLHIVQENLDRIRTEMQKYPDLDTTEAIIRIASQNAFHALANKPESEWENIDLSKLLKEANGLIKAAAYKNRLEVQSKTDYDAAIDGMKALVFDAMAKERPDLYHDVCTFLEQKKGAQ